MDDQDKIANCLVCTIADNMKRCKSCAFSIGLQFRLTKQTTLSADCLLRIEDLRLDFIKSIGDFNHSLM